MKNKKPTFYYDECWQENFYFCIGWTAQEFTEYVKRAFDHEVKAFNKLGKCLFITHDDGRTIVIIWTKPKKGPKLAATLAHEAVHAAMFCLNGRGVNIDTNNDEPLAYLVGALMRKALK